MAPRRSGALILLLLAASCGRPAGTAPATVPALILISLDGFRPDYLDRGLTPNLAALAARGVQARWLAPTFPTKTFPQHYTIVTGLHPSHHGIVANSFVDRTDGARFRYTDTASALLPRWWGGEPVWVTAERQGVRAATMFWPGSDAVIAGVRPSRWKRYDGDVPDAARVDTALAWLTLPAADRPRFVTLYFSDIDHWGHETGPDSPQLNDALRDTDAVLGRLVRGLERFGLLDRVNLVVVSDHGMTPTSERRLVFLDDYVDTTAVRMVEGGPFILLQPARGSSPDSLLAQLAAAPHLRLYRSDRTPPQWRYGDGPRVPPVVGVAEDGWLLTTRSALARRRNRYNGGDHGFDPASPTMRALFLAAGPSFRRGQVAEPFSNVHLYELLCAALGLVPAGNDGSLDSVRALLR